MSVNNRCLTTLIFVMIALADSLSLAVERELNVSSSVKQRPAQSLHTCGLTFEFMRILPGEFVMGKGGGGENGHTARRVHIARTFDICTTEVTVKQFRAFIPKRII